MDALEPREWIIIIQAITAVLGLLMIIINLAKHLIQRRK